MKMWKVCLMIRSECIGEDLGDYLDVCMYLLS